MTQQEELLADLRRKVAAEVPPELVEREMIKVLAVVVDGLCREKVRLRAVIRHLLTERRASESDNATPRPFRH
jgi:hypothetical protein